MPNDRFRADEQDAAKAGEAVASAFNGATSAVRDKAEEYRDKAEEYLGGVQDMADAATERVTATADYLRNTGATRMKADVEALVKNNPGPAILMAATVGFLLGRALSRD
jgi:ElaB/YqjD/DUF883 family membrane-anchored ribosome-binding protein